MGCYKRIALKQRDYFDESIARMTSIHSHSVRNNTDREMTAFNEFSSDEPPSRMARPSAIITARSHSVHSQSARSFAEGTSMTIRVEEPPQIQRVGALAVNDFLFEDAAESKLEMTNGFSVLLCWCRYLKMF